MKTFEEFSSKDKYFIPATLIPYWKKIIGNDNYLLNVFNTVMDKQKGYPSERQLNLLKRKESGDTTPYSSKN